MEKLLLKYLKDNDGEWFKKVHLYMIADNEGYSPETCGRCLRQLAHKGTIKVEYYDGRFSKNLAKYAYNPPVEKKQRVEYVDINGQRVARLVYA